MNFYNVLNLKYFQIYTLFWDYQENDGVFSLKKRKIKNRLKKYYVLYETYN